MEKLNNIILISPHEVKLCIEIGDVITVMGPERSHFTLTLILMRPSLWQMASTFVLFFLAIPRLLFVVSVAGNDR